MSADAKGDQQRFVVPRRILLVENNKNDVELTLTTFCRRGLADEVVVVRDGEQALQFLRRQGIFSDRREGNPTLVLLDIEVAKVGGLEVLRQMRADPALRAIPVVMLTSSREEQDIVRSYELGVDAYVVKPVGFASFIEAIRQLGLFWVAISQPSSNAVPPLP